MLRAIVVSVFVLSACGDDAKPSGQATGRTCQVSLDCQSGERCDGGKCVESGLCEASSDCAEGLVCDDRASCRACNAASDCAAGQACIGHSCVAETACSEGACGAERVCATTPDPQLSGEAVCVACLASSDCQANERCVGFVCEATCELLGRVCGELVVGDQTGQAVTLTCGGGCGEGSEACASGLCVQPMMAFTYTNGVGVGALTPSHWVSDAQVKNGGASGLLVFDRAADEVVELLQRPTLVGNDEIYFVDAVGLGDRLLFLVEGASTHTQHLTELDVVAGTLTELWAAAPYFTCNLRGVGATRVVIDCYDSSTSSDQLYIVDVGQTPATVIDASETSMGQFNDGRRVAVTADAIYWTNYLDQVHRHVDGEDSQVANGHRSPRVHGQRLFTVAVDGSGLWQRALDGSDPERVPGLPFGVQTIDTLQTIDGVALSYDALGIEARQLYFDFASGEISPLVAGQSAQFVFTHPDGRLRSGGPEHLMHMLP